MTTKLPEGVRARLQKILRLAQSGIAGEQENAKAMLAVLCAQYGVSPETLLSSEKRYYKFGISTIRDWELFKQCYFHLFQQTELNYRDAFKAVYIELTEVDMIDLRACFKHYKEAYKKAEAELFTAFVHKNGLYGPSVDDSKSEPMDPSKLERILQMLRAMKEEKWKRPVAAITS